MNSTNDQPLSAPQELALARQALDEGELQHAGFHLASALSVDPADPAGLQFFDQLYRRANGDPDRIAPLDPQDSAFFGTVALRARVLGRRGDLGQALGLLLQIVVAKPDVPYLRWSEQWLSDPRAVANFDREVLDLEVLGAQIHSAVDRLNQPATQGFDPKPALSDLARLLQRLRQAHPDHEPLALLHSIVARHAGHVMEAIEVARAQHRRAPSYMTAIALAGAYRALDQVDEALSAYREALRQDPEDLAARLDIGDLLLEADRPSDALSAYREVLEREPNHPWALPSSHYLQHLLEGGVSWIERLEHLSDAAPDNRRASDLRDSITPYVGLLPPPSEATINALRRIADQQRQQPRSATDELHIRVAVSTIEAPSVQLAGGVLLRRLHPRGRLSVTTDDIPRPDPRLPRQPVRWVLWRYDGTEPRPGLAAPDHPVAGPIAELASSPFWIDTWRRRAEVIAADLAPEWAESLLALMVHPPAGPEELAPWDWLQRVQLAAALTVAALDDGRPVWHEDSVRRQGLLSLILGPTDWSSIAGLVALTELARDETEALNDMAGRLFVDLLNTPPSQGYWCLEEPLVHCTLRLPGVPPELRAMLRQHRAELVAPSHDRDGRG